MTTDVVFAWFDSFGVLFELYINFLTVHTVNYHYNTVTANLKVPFTPFCHSEISREYTWKEQLI